MAPLSPDRLLAVWENGMRRHPIDRALLLLALAEPDAPAETLADAPLGRRNASLMTLQRAWFGARLAAWIDCPACGERMEFEADVRDLPAASEPIPESVEVAGLHFRPPTSRHLARLAGAADPEAADPEAAARQLLYDCAESPEALPTDDEDLARLLDAVEGAMEAADPWADLSLAVHCPDCGRDSSAVLDIAGLLWEEIDSHAQHLLDDVHMLAQAYGWSEPQILALSDTRRAAYLARVQP